MRSKKTCALTGMALAFCLAAGAAQAQQKPSANGNLDGLALAHAAAGRNALLENDARLNLRVSIKREATNEDEAVSALGRMTKIKMRVEDDKETELAQLAFRFQNAPLKNVLDSLAAVYGMLWVRQSGVWVLQADHARRRDYHRPHTRAQAEISRVGRELLKELAKQPAEFQAQLHKQDVPGHPDGLPFGELPSAMQSQVSAMLAANLRDRASQGDNITLALDNNSYVSLEKSDEKDYTHYRIGISASEAGTGFSFNVFHDPAENNDRIVHYQDQPTSASFYPDKEDGASRLAALNADPRLKQRFSLRMRYATLADALHALASRAGFDFAAYYQDRGAIVPERKSFAFVNLPLATVLDRLAALYGITTVFHGRQTHTWGERASGVVVFHLGPEDPNFKPPPEPGYLAPGASVIKRPLPSDPPDPP